MSSTGRGDTERAEHDKYFTPTWLVEAFFENYKNPIVCALDAEVDEWPRVLEPACGSGSIVEVLQGLWPRRSRISFFDIAPEPDFPVPAIDFLEHKEGEYDLIITNPPYTLAEEFVEHGLSLLSEKGRLALLLRVNFFAGQARYGWLSKHMPKECYVTCRRPNFRGKGTDSTEYAWFVWEKGEYFGPTATYVMDTRRKKK